MVLDFFSPGMAQMMYGCLSRLLDLGSRGIMVPRVESVAQMRDIVAQLRYAPAAPRGARHHARLFSYSRPNLL